MSALVLTLLCVAELIVFLLPGLAVLALISRRLTLSAVHTLIGVIALSALFGYVAFWIYLASKPAGQAFSFGVTAGGVVSIIAARKKRPAFFLNRDFVAPLAYSFCLALFSLSLLYLFVNPLKAGVDVANVRFFPKTRPGDNIIPFIFAERIYDRAPIRPFCCGDWLSSDRPPLQAGVFLLQRPLRIAGNSGLQYQVLGTLLQSIWVCGVWTFLSALGACRKRITQAVGLLAFSGFLFYNTVYVWPKLLAATFVLFVYAIVTRATIERRALTRSEVPLGALCFTLALLAHPGSLFSAPAILAVLLIRRNLLGLKHAALAAVILISLTVPWTLYQKFYDPPGNRLLKMHLAGVIQPDARNVVQAVRDAYGQLTPKAVLDHKLSNVRTAFGRMPTGWLDGRVTEREYIPDAIGVLNLGWVAGLALWFIRRRGTKLPHAPVMICAAALNLLVWSLVLFGPAQTVTEHGSYADILLLSLASAAFVLAASRTMAVFMLALQAFNLIFVWVVFQPASFVLPTRAVVGSALQWPMLIVAVCLGTAGLWHFINGYLRRESATPFADALLEQKAQ